MYTIKKYIMRQNTETDFYSEPEGFLKYIKDTYIDTGKITVFREKKFIDDDKLIMEIVTTFRDKTVVGEFRKDYLVSEFRKEADLYYGDNAVVLLSVDEIEE
jgi:hypothetical protein